VRRDLVHLDHVESNNSKPKQNMSKNEKLAEIAAKQAEANMAIFAMLADHGVTIINGQLVEAIENDEE